MSRYNKRAIVTNDHELYKETLRQKRLSHIRQYLTPELKYPDVEDMQNIERIGHIWTVGDRYFKLAQKHYGDAKLWYIIAWFNQKPTESHVKVGDTIYIPMPLDKVMQTLGV